MQRKVRRLAWQIQIPAVVICLLIPERTMGQAAPPLTAPGRTQNTIGMMSIGTAASRVVKEVLVHEGSRVHAGQIIVTLSCGPLEAEARARDAQLRAAEAVFDRVRHGPRPEEIAVGEAVVGYSEARAEEAAKTYGRTRALREGVSVTTAHLLETLRDARVSSAQLGEAQAKLALLQAGSREEDVREAESRRDMAAAQLEEARAQLDQCSVHAPMVSTPLASVTSTSFSSTPGNSAVRSIASLLSATSIFSVPVPNPASGERREKSSNVLCTSLNNEPNGSSSKERRKIRSSHGYLLRSSYALIRGAECTS